MQFQTWDKFAFLLPSLLVLGYWGVVGMRAALERAQKPWWRRGVLAAMVACVLAPPIFYSELPHWGRTPGLWFDRYNNQFTRNTHDGAAYVANPDKSHWNDVDAYARLVFDKLPQGAVYLDDDARVYYPLRDYYQRYLHLRPDLQVIMINSWGFGGWGLTDDAFVTLALRQLDRRDFFVVSRGFPHAGAVAKLADRGILARRFDLDDEHWIYRLERWDGAGVVVLDAELGEGFDKGPGVVRRQFRPKDPVMVRLELGKTAAPITVTLDWRGPDGETWFASKPFEMPAETTSLWSTLERDEPRPRGDWEVRLVVGDQVAGAARFRVR
jgi:hypothetical protein